MGKVTGGGGLVASLLDMIQEEGKEMTKTQWEDMKSKQKGYPQQRSHHETYI